MTSADRNRNPAPEEGGLDVRRHIVGAFEAVFEVRGAVGHRPAEPSVQIAPHLGRGVLVQGQAGRGVLQKKVGQADVDAVRLEGGVYVAGYEMDPTRPGGKG